MVRLPGHGLLFVDTDLVALDPDANQDVIAVPATHIASEEIGVCIVANIVMLGALMPNNGGC